MDYLPVDFSDDKPLDVPSPKEIKDVRAELAGIGDIDLVGLLQEISKVRLEVVRASKKHPEGPQPLSEEKGLKFLSTAINELRRLQPEVANLREDVETKVQEDFIKQLLPVIDSFDRFFDTAKDATEPETRKMDGRNSRGLQLGFNYSQEQRSEGDPSRGRV